eukprot:888-Heterococcus_DN1.PRE.3
MQSTLDTERLAAQQSMRVKEAECSELSATIGTQSQLIIDLQQQLAVANQVIQSIEFLHRAEAAEAELAVVKSTLDRVQQTNKSQFQQINTMQQELTELRHYKQSTQRDLANINKLKVNLKSIEKQKISLDARVAQLVRECANKDADHAAAIAVLQAQQTAELEALTEQYECPICLQHPVDTVITPCGHLICHGCCANLPQPVECPCGRNSSNISTRRFIT